MQYYLADDTLSVVENLPANCGRDQAPVFTKRQPVPKDFPDLQSMKKKKEWEKKGSWGKESERDEERKLWRVERLRDGESVIQNLMAPQM